MPTQRGRDYVTFFGQAGDYWLGLLTITNTDPNLAMEPLRLTSRTDQNIPSRGNIFTACGFEWRMPTRDEGESRSNFAFPVMDREILRYLKSTNIRFDLLLEVVLPDTLDEVEFSYKLRERGKTYNCSGQALVMDATFRDIISNPRPRLRYTPNRFPVLFARTADTVDD